jgi:hypothetical protein
VWDKNNDFTATNARLAREKKKSKNPPTVHVQVCASMKQLVHLTIRSYHNTFNLWMLLHVPRHGFCLLEKPETENWNSRFEQVCVAHLRVSQSRYGLTSSRRGSETPNPWTLQHEDCYQTCSSWLPINTNIFSFSFLCSNIALCFHQLMQHIKDFHYLPCEPRRNSLNALCVLHL